MRKDKQSLGWGLILVLCFFLSCSGDKQSFTLSGRFKGLEQGEFVCFSSSPEWGTFDTVRVQGGKFSITHPLADTVVLTLQYPNFMQTQLIAIPGEEVTVRGDANNMLAIEVGSDDENETLSLFRKSIADLPSDKRAAVAEQFVAEHPESWAAIAVFQKYILEAEHPDYAKMKKLLDEMQKKCPWRKVLSAMRGEVGALLAYRVGQKLPPFKATTLKGETVSNATFRGKPLLITFWSTMVPEYIYALTVTNRIVKSRSWVSRVESPGDILSPLPSGGLPMLNICLDTDTTECRRMLRRDTIAGYNVCDLLTFDSPLVRTLGVRRLPSNILVDASGVIKERDIPIDKLEATLRKYLK
ncbi:MAG: DUF4369 domain-containing protein [Bacteroidaceae bacterium]|nr:DUF4369 domain-containing protein [Bacteroidaceae bacterium]